MTLLGSKPHHERVLAVVLVVTERPSGPVVEKWSGEPNSARTEAFWQDIGRPQEGPERTPEAPEPDECVQPARPTDTPDRPWTVATNYYGRFKTCDCAPEHSPACVQNCTGWSRPVPEPAPAIGFTPKGCGHCAERMVPHTDTLVCPGCPVAAKRLIRINGTFPAAPEMEIVDPFGALKYDGCSRLKADGTPRETHLNEPPPALFNSVNGRLIVPISPDGQMTMHVENDTAVIERRFYGHREMGVLTPDRVTTFRVPVDALRQLLNPEEGLP